MASSLPQPSSSKQASPSQHMSPSDSSNINHWRAIFPHYAFHTSATSGATSTIHDLHHDPTSISQKVSSANADPNATSSDSAQLIVPEGPIHPLTRMVPPIQRTNEPEHVARQRRWIYNAAVGVCIACPLLALAPPRKIDLFTFGLGMTFCISAGFVTEQRTGQGILWHLGYRMTRFTQDGRDYQDKLEAVRLQHLRRSVEGADPESSATGTRPAHRKAWIEERMQKEEETLDYDRKGYGSLIGDQIMEVLGIKAEDDDDEEQEEDEDDTNAGK